MHFEILVEGKSDHRVLAILLPKILGEYNNPHTWKIHNYRGIGVLPADFNAAPHRNDRTLLHNLPSTLRAYGKEQRSDFVVVVLVDLDNRPSCIDFKQELMSVLETCDPPPRTLFRIAIEEVEAWYLGDYQALQLAYPNASCGRLNTYIQDSQCGTWELLADIIYPGGLQQLLSRGRRSQIVLDQKNEWAIKIPQYMDVDKNLSPSFNAFKDGLLRCI